MRLPWKSALLPNTNPARAVAVHQNNGCVFVEAREQGKPEAKATRALGNFIVSTLGGRNIASVGTVTVPYKLEGNVQPQFSMRVLKPGDFFNCAKQIARQWADDNGYSPLQDSQPVEKQNPETANPSAG